MSKFTVHCITLAMLHLTCSIHDALLIEIIILQSGTAPSYALHDRSGAAKLLSLFPMPRTALQQRGHPAALAWHCVTRSTSTHISSDVHYPVALTCMDLGRFVPYSPGTSGTGYTSHCSSVELKRDRVHKSL